MSICYNLPVTTSYVRYLDGSLHSQGRFYQIRWRPSQETQLARIGQIYSQNELNEDLIGEIRSRVRHWNAISLPIPKLNPMGGDPVQADTWESMM